VQRLQKAGSGDRRPVVPEPQVLLVVYDRLQVLRDLPDVVVADVERDRRESYDVRRPEVRDDSPRYQRLADPPALLVGDADVPSPPLRLTGRSNRVVVGRLAQHLVDEEHEVARDLQALLPDPVDVRLVHHPQAPLERGGAQHRRRPDLPCYRRLSRVEPCAHIEHCTAVVAEPAREPRRRPEVPPVHVQAPRRARPPVQVLVVAPEGEVDAPPVEVMGNDSDAVAAVEADDDLLPVRSLRQPLHVD